MTATAVGTALIRHAEALIGQLDHAAEELDAFRHGTTGSACVGAVTGPAVGFVVPAVRRLKPFARNADIRIDVAPSTDLMQGLLSGEYDFILSRIPPEVDKRRLNILHRRVETLEFVVRAGHPLTSGDSYTLEDLSRETWVIQSAGMPIRAAVEEAFLAQKIAPPAEVVSTASLLVTIAYLQSSNAIAPAPQEVTNLLCTATGGGLQKLLLTEPITMSPYYLITMAGRQISPLSKRLLSLVSDAMQAASA
jgi:DNA-binding transcriptional LysR family regulator